MPSPESDDVAVAIAKHLGIILTEDELYQQVAQGSRTLSEEEFDELLQETS